MMTNKNGLFSRCCKQRSSIKPKRTIKLAAILVTWLIVSSVLNSLVLLPALHDICSLHTSKLVSSLMYIVEATLFIALLIIASKDSGKLRRTQIAENE